MRVAVIGGTGELGSLVVDELAARGDDVRAVSRSTPAEGALPVGVEHVRADLASGEGVRTALDDVEVVLDASNDRRRARDVLVDGTLRLVAAGADAGVRHHVAISIVGCDRVPHPYYKAKVAQEEALASGTVPWSLLRATQFHALVVAGLAGPARFGVLPKVRVPLQPIDAAVVARRLADARPRRAGRPRGGRRRATGRVARRDGRRMARAHRAPARPAARPAARARQRRARDGRRPADRPGGGDRRPDVRAVAGGTMRSPAIARAALWITAASAAGVGLIAAFAPRTFYDDFPYLGHWVDRLPPYNEHLVTDVGALYLAFALVLAWAAVDAAARARAGRLLGLDPLQRPAPRLPRPPPRRLRHRRRRAGARLARGRDRAAADRPVGGSWRQPERRIRGP